MLVGVGPVLIAIFAGVLLGEGFPRSLFAGCAVAFAGVVVIGLSTSARGFDTGLGAAIRRPWGRTKTRGWRVPCFLQLYSV